MGFHLKVSLSPPLARTTGLREGREREEEGERERRERERRERERRERERRERERREEEEEKRGGEGRGLRGEEGERGEEKRGRRKQLVGSRFYSGNGKWPCNKGQQASTARGKCTSGYSGMQAQREP